MRKKARERRLMPEGTSEVTLEVHQKVYQKVYQKLNQRELLLMAQKGNRPTFVKWHRICGR